MHQVGQLAAETLERATKPRETPSELPTPNSRPDWKQPSPHQMAAANAVGRLFSLLPPQDVGDPAAFLTATIELFSRYPSEVFERAVFEIPLRSDRPTLKMMGEVMEKIYAPIARALERKRAEESHRLGLPPPRAKRTQEEQAHVDAQIEEFRKRFPLVTKQSQPEPEYLGDGKHALRVMAELAARKAMQV